MLGSIGGSKKWEWAASGKHPTAKDYFWIGAASPIVKAFSNWVERGYQSLSSNRECAKDLCAWRFWAKGAKKGAILCGLIKSSSDKIGRGYPLLVAGTGPLDNFEAKWDLVPFACEKTWVQMEYVAARRMTDFEQLESEIHSLQAPVSDWSRLEADRRAVVQGEYIAARRSLAEVAGKDAMMIPLADGHGADIHVLAGLCHLWLKEDGGQVPNAVFIGDDVDGGTLGLFKRALNPGDFVELWRHGCDR